MSFSENLVFLKDFIGFSWFWGGPREFPESSRGAQVAPGSVPASPFGPPGALDGVQELLKRSKVGPRSSKSSPKEQKVGPEGPLKESENGFRVSFSAMRSSLRISVLSVWTKKVR